MSYWVDRVIQATSALSGFSGIRNLAPLAQKIISAEKLSENVKLALRNYLAIDLVETAAHALRPRPLSFPEILRKAMLAKRATDSHDVNMRYAGLGIIGAASLYSVPVPAFLVAAVSVLFDILQDSVMMAERRSNRHGEAFRALYIPVEYADILDNVLEDEFLAMLRNMFEKNTLPSDLLNIRYGELTDDSAFYVAYKRQMKLAIESFVCSRYNVQISLDNCEQPFFDAPYDYDDGDDEDGALFSPARSPAY